MAYCLNLMPITTDCSGMDWAEQETYADRCKGAKLGIYSNKVKDNVARYMVPQECGAKCGVRWARVTNRAGDGMLFEMTEETGASGIFPHCRIRRMR
ncbi:MAG: hypothetical protein ACLUPG_19230 [Roseburia faecis]